jgi:hypothetical protein
MRIKAEDFSSISGHVFNGCEVVTPSGKVYTLRNRMNGWMFYDENKTAISGYLTCDYDVEFFVINGLSQGR